MTDNDTTKQAEPSPEQGGEAAATTDHSKIGFGHRAHQPDPDAKYGFEPDRIRPLPVDPGQRWR